MDLFNKCNSFEDAEAAREAGTYPYFIPLDRSEGTEVVFEGRRIIMCGSNNYLGLTTNPKVREAAKNAIDLYGTSCTGSRFLNGNMTIIEELERQLAEWVGKEAALVFSTGMQVNLGTISSLIGKDDFVILDKEDHASIVDVARLGMGKIERFRHNDVEHLERVLKSLPPDSGKLLVVDGLFSMEGDIAPLPDAPVAQADVLHLVEDTELVIDVTTLLANDHDPDLNGFWISSVTALEGVSVTLTEAGQIRIQPEAKPCCALRKRRIHVLPAAEGGASTSSPVKSLPRGSSAMRRVSSIGMPASR